MLMGSMDENPSMEEGPSMEDGSSEEPASLLRLSEAVPASPNSSIICFISSYICMAFCMDWNWSSMDLSAGGQ